ncbi:hypothetical protein N7481_010895 [Penicillium waksmanii]|uniref:uncharacterized protein n=1 Tax=Penicillium waksmanii TaxID=69791 RepID=UPI002548EF03|nr:uncharacterized protein N7481_010895 [Penicillium waksmanii]KAJ5973685.1 hypothetical protein N7481_010895 [Penicillium waksmanii]
MDSSKKKSDRLARVRANQRNSRARKQEYLQELEQRLAAFQTEDRRKEIEHRLALQKMEAENRHLKTLLNSLGISTELLQQYVQLAEQGNSVDGKVAIPAMHQHVKTSTTQPVKEKPVPATSNSIAPAVMTEKTPEKTAEPIDKTWEASDPPLCKCSPGQRDLASGPVDGDVLNTTLCAIAEELINQYNTRGKDLEEIRQRLWSGFQSGVTGDGCRVQNNVLFEVLDEISHNV